MQVTIKPSLAHGTVQAPPSKSMAHRLLIGAALAQGTSTIRHARQNDDIAATLDCLKALGVPITENDDTVTVQGIDPTKTAPQGTLCCRESGSTLRFFLPIALLSDHPVTFTGSETLLKRPMQVYETLCNERGLFYQADAQHITVQGPLQPGEFRVAGNISSQFISGLLFALPLLSGDSRIRLTPPIESRSYIELTRSALNTFGVKTAWEDEKTLLIRGNQSYTAQTVTVEGDYSGAAFFAALNELDSAVTVEGLLPDSLQGDRVYTEHFAALSRGTPVIHLADCPDLGPILFAVAAAKNGGVFTGTRRLKMKESDRAETMAQELRKCGAAVTVHDDSVVVFPQDFHTPTEPLDGHNDHRVVMSLAVLLTRVGGTIRGAQAVRKSFPDFFQSLKSLGVEVTVDETE